MNSIHKIFKFENLTYSIFIVPGLFIFPELKIVYQLVILALSILYISLPKGSIKNYYARSFTVFLILYSVIISSVFLWLILYPPKIFEGSPAMPLAQVFLGLLSGALASAILIFLYLKKTDKDKIPANGLIAFYTTLLAGIFIADRFIDLI